jgi:hypothetical protein
MKSTQKINPDLLPQKLSTMEYPTAIGSINFRKEDIGGRWAESRNNLKDSVQNEIAQLVGKLEDLGRYYQDSERIYSARVGFMPTPGHTYHLYESPEDWVSLLGPEEWDRDDYVGSFKFDGQGWERVK